MPRPKKKRLCQGGICGKAFKPTGIPLTDLRQISLQADEVEALRLCDLLGLTQEEAGQRMGVSRGTVQRILSSARRKAATALVEGAALVLETQQAEKETGPALPGSTPGADGRPLPRPPQDND